ncbi:MAG: hypothetical protein UY98_C0022G0001, partial [Candidatus Kaiserbacteria bacterium GW2011_GWA2_58_9]
MKEANDLGVLDLLEARVMRADGAHEFPGRLEHDDLVGALVCKSARRFRRSDRHG